MEVWTLPRPESQSGHVENAIGLNVQVMVLAKVSPVAKHQKSRSSLDQVLIKSQSSLDQVSI
jgi:hypothetical protein